MCTLLLFVLLSVRISQDVYVRETLMVLTVRSVYLFSITDLIAPERLVKVMTLVACLVYIYL